MGKFLQLRPITRTDKSFVGILSRNFNSITDALRTLSYLDVGAAAENHTHPIIVEGIQNPILINGWVNFGFGHYDAGFYKDPHGRVHLRGTIQNGVIGQDAFVLPIGYRPTSTLVFAVATAAGTFGAVDVESDGSVKPTVGNNGLVTLAGISFKADQ